MYHIFVKVDSEWSLCLVEFGLLYNKLSPDRDKREIYRSFHVNNEAEADNYIKIQRMNGDERVYKVLKGKYNFSNLDELENT